MAATKATGHFEHLELRIRLSSTSDGACIPQVIGTCAGIGCPSAVYAWLQLCCKGPMHPDYICPMEANRWSATWICPKSINISHVQQEKGFGIRDMLTNFDLKRMNLQWMQPARQASGCISGGLERCPSCYTLHSVLWRGNLRLPWDEPKMKAIWPRLLSTAQVSMLKSDGCRNTPRRTRWKPMLLSSWSGVYGKALSFAMGLFGVRNLTQTETIWNHLKPSGKQLKHLKPRTLLVLTYAIYANGSVMIAYSQQWRRRHGRLRIGGEEINSWVKKELSAFEIFESLTSLTSCHLRHLMLQGNVEDLSFCCILIYNNIYISTTFRIL